VDATRRFATATFARVGLRYVVEGERDGSVGITHAFGAASLDAGIDVRGGGASPFEARGFVTLHWSFAEQRATMHALTRASTTDGASNEVIAHQAPAHAVGGVATTLGLRESPTAYAATAAAAYTGYTVVGAATSTVTLDRARHDAVDATAVEVGTALAFAGGRAAWSRPISGSFVIVAATESLAGEEIGVDPSRGGFAARTSAGGLAVVPNLEPYRVGTIRLAAPMLPLGVSLGPTAYHVVPGYRTGTLISVGTKGTVFLRGVVTLDGIPLPFATGALTSPSARPLELMTNRAGRFSVIDVAAGRYQLAIGGGTTTIVVPPGAHGIIDLGLVSVHDLASP
jgi:outer membrane usher protein